MHEIESHNPYLERLQSNFYKLLDTGKMTPPKHGFSNKQRDVNRRRNKVARKSRLLNRRRG